MSPILSGNHANTEFAPFNTRYDDLEKDTQRAGILNKPNNWQTPMVLDSDQPISWKLTPPADFFYYVIPYDLRLVKSNLAKIPQKFHKDIFR